MLYRWVGEKICDMYGRNVPNRRCVCAGVFRLTALTTFQIQREAVRLPECMSKVEGDRGVRGCLRMFQAKKWVKQVSLESRVNAVTFGTLTFT